MILEHGTQRNKEPVLMRPAELAKTLDVSTQTIWRWTKQDGYPQPLKVGRIVYHDSTKVIEWLMSKGVSND